MEKKMIIAMHKLSERKYIAELTNCLAVVTTDENGEIIRVATFGEKEGDEKNGK